MEIAIIIILLIVLMVISIYSVFNRNEKINSDEIIKYIENIDRNVKSEISENRKEINTELKNFSVAQGENIRLISDLQKTHLESFTNKLDKLTDENINKLEQMRTLIESKLNSIQQNNQEQLERMRVTVDEKLHTTLEKRLSESFRIVTEHLQLVQQGLGEMKSLATGVGRLEKVLSNVKTKGVLGEYQLYNILEQILSPEQYSTNVKTKKGSNNVVEFAVRMPGGRNATDAVWLPIDSKFPSEDYENLLNAYDNTDLATIEQSRKQLVTKINLFAKDISEKYIDPPNTTDFAIMFLPFEGLYAEILRIPGLFEDIVRKYKVTITGPTTISAFLNSLQMGFRTLAIEKRSGEVFKLLEAVKNEFGEFGNLLDKTRAKLNEATKEIEKAGTRTRSIERKLNNVQELNDESNKVLPEE